MLPAKWWASIRGLAKGRTHQEDAGIEIPPLSEETLWHGVNLRVKSCRPVPLGYGAAYLGGVVATASPCILASIPLIIGFVGGYAEGNKKQAFFYSLTFVLGLAVVMSILGAVASLAGTMFGQVGSFWRFVVAGILMVMGLHLSGIINLKLGGNAQRFLPRRTGLSAL